MNDNDIVFLQCDQAGAEALVVAYLCRPGKLRDLFTHGVKPHTYVAMHLFADIWRARLGSNELPLNVPIAELKNWPRWKELEKYIKESDNEVPSKRYYYFAKQTCHCVTADHQVLTKKGWINIDSKPEEIMVWNTNGTCEFQKVLSWNEFDYQGKIHWFGGKAASIVATPNHKVVYTSNKKHHVKEIDEIKGIVDVPFSSKIKADEQPVNERICALLELAAAFQADGSKQYDCAKINFRFGKKYKIDRMHKTLNALGIPFETKPETDGYFRTRFYPPDEMWNYVKYVDGVKLFKEESILSLNEKELNYFSDALLWWDAGCVGRYRKVYRTTVKHNADLAHTVFRITGKGGYVLLHGDVYEVSVNKRKYTVSRTYHISNYIGKVYCPSVSTGMFYVRHKDKISITHNSANYGIKAPTFVMNVLDKSEGQVVIPLVEGQRFLSTYHNLFPEIQNWHAQLQTQLNATRELKNLFGYPRYFHGMLTEQSFKEAYAFIPQSTVGCITHRAAEILQRMLDGKQRDDFAVLQNNHDSLLVQCCYSNHKEIAALMTNAMNCPLTNERGEQFTMRSEVGVGVNWKDIKEIKG